MSYSRSTRSVTVGSASDRKESRRARAATAEVATKAAFNRSLADLTMLEFLLNDRAAAAQWPSARPAMNVVIDLRESRGAVTR